MTFLVNFCNKIGLQIKLFEQNTHIQSVLDLIAKTSILIQVQNFRYVITRHTLVHFSVLFSNPNENLTIYFRLFWNL